MNDCINFNDATASCTLHFSNRTEEKCKSCSANGVPAHSTSNPGAETTNGGAVRDYDIDQCAHCRIIRYFDHLRANYGDDLEKAILALKERICELETKLSRFSKVQGTKQKSKRVLNCERHIDQIKQLRELGITLSVLAGKYKVSEATIRRLLQNREN